MNIVVEVIAAYLLSNRRLVVPAFGAFMVKESGERVFSELLRTDDGVLASLLREKGLNEMEVAVMVDRFIFEVRHELEQYGYCRLGEIGTLRIEPSTKVLRLYPPVQGEIPKQTPYIPKPIQPTESEEVVVAPKEESVTNEEPKIGCGCDYIGGVIARNRLWLVCVESCRGRRCCDGRVASGA